jgi:hypothetical protein
MTTRQLMLATALLACAGSAAAQSVFQIIPNPGSTVPGPASLQYDVVVVFDGYTAATQAGQAVADGQALRGALLANQPYAAYGSYLNVWGIYRQSLQAGVDQPQNGIFRDTAYNCSYNQSALNGGPTPRCVLLTDTTISGTTATQPLGTSAFGRTLAYSDAITLAPGCDGNILAIVNDPLYGGCARPGSDGAAYNGTGGFLTGAVAAVHELGHMLPVLGDEYTGANGGLGGLYPLVAMGEPTQANLTTIVAPLKWQPWVNLGSVFAPPIQGGAGYDTGIFHPAGVCMMNLGNAPYCVVCTESVLLEIYRCADSIIGAFPSVGALVQVTEGDIQNFNIIHRVPNLIPGQAVITWTVDGFPAPGATGTGFLNLDTTGYTSGPHTVSVSVTDNSPFLASPNPVMTKSRTWTMIVSPPTPDFRLEDVFHVGLPVEAGTDITVGATLWNDGTGPGNVVVKYYLMLAAGTPNPAVDYYLGQEKASVPAAPQTNLVGLFSQHPIPFHLPAGSQWFVGAIADPANVVVELDETNNTNWFALSFDVDAPTGCPIVLEFDAPGSQGTEIFASGSAGGSFALDITAPCNANDFYAILISVSGTTPGLPLPNGMVLPIIYDFATRIGLDLLNIPPFIAFAGLLDGDGRGSATFAPPPGLMGAGGFGVYFAAATYTLGPTVFTGVTNPVVMGVIP